MMFEIGSAMYLYNRSFQMASDKDAMVLTPIQRKKVCDALDTHINVLKRRINAEKSDAIKEIIRADVRELVALAGMFTL